LNVVSGDIKLVSIFAMVHPWDTLFDAIAWAPSDVVCPKGDFRPLRRRSSESVRDSAKVTISH